MKKESSDQDNDIFGIAILAYQENQDETDIIVHSPDFDDDVIPVPYLFRSYNEMPPLEKKGLELCRGKVLDVGCGAGSHSLYLQNTKKLNVTAIDISKGAVEVARRRGVHDARVDNYFELKNEKFDTILLLMNGTGIIGKLNRLDAFFSRTRELLNPGGSLIIDSSDLKYLYDEEEDGGIWVDMATGYYGEMQYSVSYKGHTSSSFPWLYLDYNTLQLAASKNGFSCHLIKEGEHYDYLAEIKLS